MRVLLVGSGLALCCLLDWLIDIRQDTPLGVRRLMFAGQAILWLGAGASGTFFASTKLALEVVERYLELELKKRALDEGTLVELRRGREKTSTRFNPNREFEETPLPAVRAPNEAAFCLRRLATLVAAAH